MTPYWPADRPLQGERQQCPDQHTMLAHDKDAESPLRASMQKDAQPTQRGNFECTESFIRPCTWHSPTGPDHVCAQA